MDARIERIASAPMLLKQVANPAAIRAVLPAGDAPRAEDRAAQFARCALELLHRGVAADASAVCVFVPGRVEVMGKHTDYCGGRSLLCAVDRGFHFVATRREDRVVRVVSIDEADAFETTIDVDLPLRPGHWSNYPLTTIRRLARNFEQQWTGCDIAFTSDLPPAAGLSSSSALIIGAYLVLAAINGLDQHAAYRRNIQTPEDLASYLGCVENGSSYHELTGDLGVGTFGGSQDHTAILFARPHALVQYRFSPVHHEATVSLPQAFRFVIASSGVKAEKTGDARERYNAVSLRAWRLVSLWNDSQRDKATNLREVLTQPDGPRRLQTLIEALPSAVEQRFMTERLSQYQQETGDFIPRATDAIRSGNWSVFGQIVDLSQRLTETSLHNQVPETIALQRALRAGGAMAASAFGAGFGGSAWALVEDEAAAHRMLEKSRGAGFGAAFVSRAACAAYVI